MTTTTTVTATTAQQQQQQSNNVDNARCRVHVQDIGLGLDIAPHSSPIEAWAGLRLWSCVKGQWEAVGGEDSTKVIDYNRNAGKAIN